MANYASRDYLIHGFLLLSFLAQLAPALYALRICKMTGWVRFWSTSWIIWVGVMLWIMLRRVVVAWMFNEKCYVDGLWLFDQVVNPIITSIGLTTIAVLKFRFYKYWLEASILRINGKKKTIANERITKERGHIRNEQQAYENQEKDYRDRGPA